VRNKGKLEFSEKLPRGAASDSKTTPNGEGIKKNRPTTAENSDNISVNADVVGGSDNIGICLTRKPEPLKRPRQPHKVETVTGDLPKSPVADNPTNSVGGSDNVGVYLTRKPESKLQFGKDEVALTPEPKKGKGERKIDRLERKGNKYDKKLERARDNLPGSRTIEKKSFVLEQGTDNDKIIRKADGKLALHHGTDKDKLTSKLTFEKEHTPIGEAKWNQPKKKSVGGKVARVATTAVVNKIRRSSQS